MWVPHGQPYTPVGGRLNARRPCDIGPSHGRLYVPVGETVAVLYTGQLDEPRTTPKGVKLDSLFRYYTLGGG